MATRWLTFLSGLIWSLSGKVALYILIASCLAAKVTFKEYKIQWLVSFIGEKWLIY